jgi:hypothetical protein
MTHLQAGEELVCILVLLYVDWRAVIVLEGIPEVAREEERALAQRHHGKHVLQYKEAVQSACSWEQQGGVTAPAEAL